MIGNPRATDRAEINRVERTQLRQPIFGHHPAVFLIVRRAPTEGADVEFETAIGLLQGCEHFKPRLDDFDPDAVAGDGGDSMGAHQALFGGDSPMSQKSAVIICNASRATGASRCSLTACCEQAG